MPVRKVKGGYRWGKKARYIKVNQKPQDKEELLERVDGGGNNGMVVEPFYKESIF